MATRAELIVSVLSLAVQLFVGLHVVYDRPLSLDTALIYVLCVFVTGLSSTIANMILIFFSEVNLRLKTGEKASINLINGMHEGLLILSTGTS